MVFAADNKTRYWQYSVFVLGWIGYASTYLLRKPLGIIKTDLLKDANLKKANLGVLDMALLLPYAFVQTFFGSAGDVFGARVTYSFSLLMAGISLISFGFWLSFPVFVILLAFSGGFQALCWPNASKIISGWFPDDARNTIFGVYGTSAFAGGIVGTLLTVKLQILYGWQYVYLWCCLIVIVIGIISTLVFKESHEIPCEIPAMFTLKLVRYTIYMWLPMYLSEHLQYDKESAGYYSAIFEVGGVIGSILIGWGLDRFYQNRALVGCTWCFIIFVLALIAFSITTESGRFFNALFMIICGGFNCGADGILAGSVACELGQLDHRNGAAAVVGFINGFGSFGAVFEGPIIGILADLFGWDHIFYLMIAFGMVGTICVWRAAKKYQKYVSPRRPTTREKLLRRDDVSATLMMNDVPPSSALREEHFN